MDDFMKIEKLEEAREHLQAAQDIVEEVFTFNGRVDGNVKAYFLDQLAIHTSSNSGFLSNNVSIDTLINRVEGGEDEGRYYGS